MRVQTQREGGTRFRPGTSAAPAPWACPFPLCPAPRVLGGGVRRVRGVGGGPVRFVCEPARRPPEPSLSRGGRSWGRPERRGLRLNGRGAGVPQVPAQVHAPVVGEPDALGAQPLLHHRRRLEVAPARERPLAVDDAVARNGKRVARLGNGLERPPDTPGPTPDAEVPGHVPVGRHAARRDATDDVPNALEKVLRVSSGRHARKVAPRCLPPRRRGGGALRLPRDGLPGLSHPPPPCHPERSEGPRRRRPEPSGPAPKG